MKKRFILLPLICLVLALTYWSFQPQKKPVKTTAVLAGMGSRGADCGGSGICSIDPPNGGNTPAEGFPATLGYDDQGRLFLEFENSALPSSVYAVQFCASQFTKESDCPIPLQLLNEIEAPVSALSIQAGVYSLQKSGQTVRITF